MPRATAIGFLRQYGLDRDFKLNIDAGRNRCAPPRAYCPIRAVSVYEKKYRVFRAMYPALKAIR